MYLDMLCIEFRTVQKSEYKKIVLANDVLADYFAARSYILVSAACSIHRGKQQLRNRPCTVIGALVTSQSIALPLHCRASLVHHVTGDMSHLTGQQGRYTSRAQAALSRQYNGSWSMRMIPRLSNHCLCHRYGAFTA